MRWLKHQDPNNDDPAMANCYVSAVLSSQCRVSKRRCWRNV